MTKRANILDLVSDERLSNEQVLGLASFQDELYGEPGEKTADAKSQLMNTLLQGLVLGGAGTIGGALAYGGADAVGKAWSAATRGRDLRRITDVYPQLKKEDPKELNLAYNSLRHLNPHFAKDPLVGGTLLGEILRSRDATNPRGPGSMRFSPDLAQNLLRSAPRGDDTVRRLAADQFAGGMRDALQQSAKDRASAKMEEMRQSFTSSRDSEARAHQDARDSAAQQHARSMYEQKIQDDMAKELYKSHLRDAKDPGIPEIDSDGNTILRAKTQAEAHAHARSNARKRLRDILDKT
jgi:hypothetical protein